MVDDLARRILELRFLDGIEKVEHVPYQTGDQFWVRFNKPLDLKRLQEVVKNHGYSMVSFANIPSKLPRKLSELIWDGVNLVIAKNVSGWVKFQAFLGFEPEGIAKIATDLHGPYQIFMTTEEAGVQVLYEYLGVKYVPPPPPTPPKPTAPAKPVTPTVTGPAPPPSAQPPTLPVSAPAAVAGPAPPSQPQQAKPVPQQQPTAPTETADPTQTQTKKEPPTQRTG